MCVNILERLHILFSVSVQFRHVNYYQNRQPVVIAIFYQIIQSIWYSVYLEIELKSEKLRKGKLDKNGARMMFQF